MNSIVFVLVVFTNNGHAVPTTEFSSMEKCQKGLVQYQNAVGNLDKSFEVRGIRKGTCVRIEK